MILIQDILTKEVEWTRTDLNLDNAMFKFSTPNEFIATVKKLPIDKKFPFFFVNSGLVEYDFENKDDIIVTVGEIVISTKTKSNYTSEQRDEFVFKPILTPFLDMFLYRLEYNQQATVFKAGKIKYHYFYGKTGLYGTDGNIFEDSVDAIQLTNFQFRILTNKNNKICQQS